MDRELPPCEAEAVAAHLASCAECRRKHVAFMRVDSGLRRGFASMAVPPMRASLARPRRSAQLLTRPVAVAAAAAAVVAISAGVIWIMVHPGESRNLNDSGGVVSTPVPQPIPPVAVAGPDEAVEDVDIPEPRPIPPVAAARRHEGSSEADEAVRRELERLDTAVRLPKAVDTLPAWKVEELRRVLLYSNGIVPEYDG